MSETTTDLFEEPSKTSPRVLPLISDKGNRKQLIKWVDAHDSFEDVSFDGDLDAVDFDVCILDEGALQQYQSALAQVKEEADPVIVPSLLLSPEYDASRFESEGIETNTPATVNEVAGLPVKQKELEWRLRSLLRLREQSVQAYRGGRRYQTAKQQLYDIIRKNVPFDQKAREALELGARYLDTDVGFLNRFDVETGYMEASITADITDGQTIQAVEHDLSKTYCYETIEDEDPLAIHDAPEEGWADDPAFETSGVHTYLGTPLIVDEEIYGTVCFIAKEPRSEPFTEVETRFAEHLTRLLEQELRHELLAGQLTNQTNLATVLNRVLRHNLRNDISVIRGYTEMLADQVEDADTVETILDNVDGLIDLTETARELEEIISATSERRHTEICSFMEELVEPFAKEYPNASISVEYDEEIHVSVLENFDRALEELIENAVKHSGDRSTVFIEIERVPNAVQIRIHDNGPGLPDQEAKVLTAGEESPLIHGSGLGLWLVHWIIDSHEGSIDPEVTEDGTTMTISIPRKPSVSIQEQLTELTKSRDKYNTTFEKAKDLMVILNDEGQIIEANAAMGTVLGLNRQELLGQPITEFLPDEFDFETKWRELMQTGSQDRDTAPIIDTDGVERVLEYSATVDIIPGEHLIVGRDVTEQKERERELRETKQRLDLVLEGTDTGVWVYDIETDEVNWDETMELLFGLEKRTFEGTFDAFLERVHPEDREKVENSFQAAIKEDERYDVEYRIQRDDGEIRWVQAKGVTDSSHGHNQMVGIARDITNRRERERELESLKERYQTLLDAAPDPVFVADAETAEIIEVNEAAERLFGESRDDIIGRHQSDLHPSEKSEQYRQSFEEYVGVNGTTRSLPDGSQTFIEKSDGEKVPVEISVDTVSLPEGTVMFGIFRDISEQIERERELREAKRRFDLALEGTNSGVWDWDMETDEVTWNETMERLFGLEPGTFEGTFDAFRERVHPEDRETVENAIQTAIEDGERYEAEYRIQRDDGEQIWALAHGGVFTDEGSDQMVGLVTDITDRKEREQALASLKERYQTLLDAAPDPVFVADSETGKLIEVNENAERVLGESHGDIIGRHYSEIHPSEQSEQYRQLFEEFVEKGGTSQQLPNGSQIFVVTNDGEKVPVEISVDTVSLPDRSVIFGIFRDISERVKRERELAEATRQLEAIVQNSSEAIYIKDTEGYYQFINESGAELFDYTPEEIIGKHDEDLFDPESAADIRAADKQVIESGEMVSEETVRFIDGEKHLFLDNKYPYRDEDGEIIGMIGISPDITERK